MLAGGIRERDQKNLAALAGCSTRTVSTLVREASERRLLVSSRRAELGPGFGLVLVAYVFETGIVGAIVDIGGRIHHESTRTDSGVLTRSRGEIRDDVRGVIGDVIDAALRDRDLTVATSSSQVGSMRQRGLLLHGGVIVLPGPIDDAGHQIGDWLQHPDHSSDRSLKKHAERIFRADREGTGMRGRVTIINAATAAAFGLAEIPTQPFAVEEGHPSPNPEQRGPAAHFVVRVGARVAAATMLQPVPDPWKPSVRSMRLFDSPGDGGTLGTLRLPYLDPHEGPLAGNDPVKTNEPSGLMTLDEALRSVIFPDASPGPPRSAGQPPAHRSFAGGRVLGKALRPACALIPPAYITLSGPLATPDLAAGVHAETAGTSATTTFPYPSALDD
jgi:hypothetical protein